MLANRNQPGLNSNEFDPPRQHPHVADLVWALAKSEAVKLEAVKAALPPDTLASTTKTSDHLVATVTVPSSELKSSSKVDERIAAKKTAKPPQPPEAPEDPIRDEEAEEDRVELGFSLNISELKAQQDNRDCDSGILFQSTTNFASSFNTDVGYSSETSRAPSYPSSVVFKRRTYTNKSISQNYSSLTESIGSQPADMALEPCDMVHARNSPSPMTPMDSDDLPVVMTRIKRIRHLPTSSNGDPRRLSYKRACDPDKRISLAFDSMLSGDSDLSYGSQTVPPPPPVDPNHLNHGHRSPREGSRRQSDVADEPPAMKQQYVTEGTETDDRWLKRRKSYQKSSNRMNRLQQSLGQQEPDGQCSVNCWLLVYQFVRSVLQAVIQSPWMDFFITISIILNTAFLAAEHHGMSPDVKHVLDVGNKVRYLSSISFNLAQ